MSFRCLAVLVGSLLTCSTTMAQPAVDVLVLKGGEELRGLRWGNAGPRAVWYVSRVAWLREGQPALARRLEQEQADREVRTRADLVRRLQIWKTSLEGTNAKDLGVIADDWIERYKEPARPGAYVATRIEAGQPTRIVAARPGLTRLALVAWRENVEGVERKPAAEIAGTLKEAGIAWEKESTDLLERLPGLPVQDEADWKARLAFLDYQSTTKLHLQGTGEAIVETPAEGAALAAGQIEALMARVGKSTLEKALGDLLGDTPAPRPAQAGIPAEALKLARDRKAPVFRLSQVEPDLAGGKVLVVDRLISMRGALPEVVWQVRLEENGANADRAVVERLKKDPQIAKVIGAAEALGAGASLDQALRAGAVTLESWRKADGKFQEVARVATRRLDGVPLSWLEAR